MSPSSKIPEEEKIPLKNKCLVSAGGAVQYLTSNVNLGQLWMPVMNIGYGLNPAILGLVAMILKAVDAVVDPLIGNLSDSTRSRWVEEDLLSLLGLFLPD